MAVTAKVTVNSVQSWGEGENKLTTLGFCPDYMDGANKEWSNSTPHLDLRMTVKGPVADNFPLGSKITLTFTLDSPN